MPPLDLAALSVPAIHLADTAPQPIVFAANELQRYLAQITGRALTVQAHAGWRGDAVLVLGDTAEPAAAVGSSGASFAIIPEARRITLRANAPRALLDAVYSLLAQCGCRWSLPGFGDEFVPHPPVSTLCVEARVQPAPRFRVRGYCTDVMTWHYTQAEQFASRLDEDRAFIDWMGKSGANAFLFIRHPFDSQLTIPELLPDFARRGIAVEYGGHVMPILLPRELFQQHPDYFPQTAQGERTDNGNLCPSNDAALALASDNAVAWVRQYPEMSAVHLWGADLWKGGWCHCAACRGVSVQDQSLRVCNAVAQGLAAGGVGRPVCYLAYHDTIEPDLRLRPDPGVVVEFAPRERCYGHALNDATCATNQRYARALERYVDLFDGRVRMFEYYGDAILFCGCAVPLTEVIGRDLDYFQRLGIAEITFLQFGTYSLWAHPLNFLAYAAATTNGGHGGMDAPAFAHFGPHAEAVRESFVELERLMRNVVTYADVMRPPRRADRAAEVRLQLDNVVPQLGRLADRFAGVDMPSVIAHAALLRYTDTLLRGVQLELKARLASGKADTTAARELYASALHIVDSVDRRFKGLWGTVDLSIIHAIHAMDDGRFGP